MAEYCYTCEAFRFRAGLGLCDCGLKGCGGCISFSGLGSDKAKSDEVVRVRQGEEVIPVALVESGQGGKDQDGLLIRDRIGCSCQVIEVIVYYWWRYSLAVRLSGLFSEGGGRW